MSMTEKIAGQKAMEARNNKECAQFSFETIRLIADMVKEGIWPNGHFSDDECNLWEVFTEVNRAEVHRNLLFGDEKKKAMDEQEFFLELNGRLDAIETLVKEQQQSLVDFRKKMK